MRGALVRLFLTISICSASTAFSATPAELCVFDDQSWTAPAGTSTLRRVVVVGAGAAGGADAGGNFGAAGKAEPVGGSTAGTSWGAGGAGGLGAGGGAAGNILDQANVSVSGTVAIKVGKPGTTAGASGSQSCFGTNCAAGGAGGGLPTDFSPVGGGQAGWGGSNGTSQKNSATQEFGTVYTGQVSSPKTITIVNNSGAASTVQTITPPAGVVLSSDACSGSTLPAGGSCTFRAALSPTSTGEINLQIAVQTQRGKLNVPLHATAAPPPTCPLPWGGTLANGSAVTAYLTTSVPFGSTCTSESRTCNNGTLSGTYTNQACSAQAPANCSLPWGGSLSHGSSVTAYANSSVPYGSSCASQSRTCSNGTLSGSYTNSSCTVQPGASCSAPWGGSIADGSSVYAYQASSAASCSGQWRTCTNGSLSGSYQYSSCTVKTYTWQWTSGPTNSGYATSGFCGSSTSNPAGTGCSSPGATQGTYYCSSPGGWSLGTYFPYSYYSGTLTCK